MANAYYFTLYDNGQTGWTLSDEAVNPPANGHFVTYEEYTPLYVANREAAYQSALTQKQEEVARTLLVRDGYVTIGLDPVTAGAMSGYTAATMALADHIANHAGYIAVRPTPAEVAAA